LTADPVEEARAGRTLLEVLACVNEGMDLIACPSCGRAEVDVIKVATKPKRRCSIDLPIKSGDGLCRQRSGRSTHADLESPPARSAVTSSSGQDRARREGDEMVEALVEGPS